MVMFWTGVLFVSGSWLFLFPVFTPSREWLAGISLAGAGIALLGWGGVLASRDGKKGLSWKGDVLQWVWLGLMMFGLQFLALQAVRPWAAQYHEARLLSPVLRALCAVLGVPASVDQGVLFVQTEEEVVPFVTNWEKLGLVMPLALMMGMGVCCAVGPTGWRSKLKSLGLSLGALVVYLLARYLIVCGYLVEFADLKGQSDFNPMWAFAGSWRTLLSFVPFAFVCGKLRLVELSPKDCSPRRPNLGRRPLAGSTALAGVGIGLVLTAANLHLPGPVKPGRILVDDYHSGFWEPSALQLDTTGFGSKYLYSYSSLIEWLNYYFRVTVNETEPLTEANLSQVDVLIIKTPSKRYAAAEIEAIVRFVRRGGGLFLIGDHTNLLGMGAFLNELASHFGVRFRYDACNAFSTGYFSYFHSPALFAHPIVQGLEPFKFMTSCSLDCDRGAERVMTAYDIVSDPVDYSKPSFFGRLIPGTRSGFGLFTVAAAARAGLGRVLMLADSTPFSNFSMFQETYPEFFLNACAYLNQTNEPKQWLAWTGIGLGLALLVVAVWLAADGGATAFLTTACLGGLAGYLAAGEGLREFQAKAFPPPVARTTYPQVAFLTHAHIGFGLPPAIGPSFIAPEYAFDSMFVVPQRFGAFPVLVNASSLPASGLVARERVASAVRAPTPGRATVGDQPSDPKFRTVVLVNPDDQLPASYLQALHRYIESGGHLIVFHSKEFGDAALQALLATNAPGVKLGETRYLVSVPTNSIGNLTNTIPSGATAPALAATNLTATCGTWAIGLGKLFVVSDSALFSRAQLGHVMVEPDEARLKLYQVMFEVFGEAIGPVERPKLK
jgi:hypothetical protein